MLDILNQNEKRLSPKEFLNEIDPNQLFLSMLGEIKGVSFFVKDKNFRLIFANPFFLQKAGAPVSKGVTREKTISSSFPEPLANKFRKDDEVCDDAKNYPS